MAACCYLANGHDIALRFWRPCRLRGYVAPSLSGVSGSTTCSMESTKRVGRHSSRFIGTCNSIRQGKCQGTSFCLRKLGIRFDVFFSVADVFFLETAYGERERQTLVFMKNGMLRCRSIDQAVKCR